jgi:Pvc16 N-terminal domain
VIQDVDDTLKELLVQKAHISTADTDIKFEMPNQAWSAAVTKPTINLFLYDVRENHELRSNDPTITRNAPDANGVMTGVVSRPPVRMDLSYLITVWIPPQAPNAIADEHRLLGVLLNTLLLFPLLPDEVLKGAMQTQAFPVHAWIAQPERLPNPWEFWGHMDHGMKASLNFVLTTSWQPFATDGVVLVKEKGVTIILPTSRPNPTTQTQ